MIKQIELQRLLFEEDVSRNTLRSFVSEIEKKYTISVYRNHSFELIESTIHPYLEYANIGTSFVYSDYDDSLSFFNLDLSSDLLILWLDITRYKTDNPEKFIAERLEKLQQIYKGTILFAPFGKEISFKSERVVTYNFDQIQKKLANKFLDERMESFSGTKISISACLEISKDLGLNYIPALLRPLIKAVVVDLDNTLYQGVLGEDGIDGVVLTDGHKHLQKTIKSLSEKGFFVCIASKNDESDVINLFKKRTDFVLTLDDFTKICASWNSKADSISEIAKFLNIDSSSLLFVDDNLGEIVSVLERHPHISVLLANKDGNITDNVLKNMPGLLKLHVKKEDSLRKNDVQANEQRQELLNKYSKEEYIKQLGMELTYQVDKVDNIKRVSELAGKTNQFIFSYQRYSAAQVEELMNDANSHVIAISLKDNLSDSGIIGSVILKKTGHSAILDECFVSCRALGRGIDEVIVLGAISTAMKSLGVNNLQISFKQGERNLPAQNFVEEYLLKNQSEAAPFVYSLPENLLKINIEN